MRISGIAILFALTVPAAVHAQDVPRLPDQPHIVVVGAGSASANADYLELRIRVSATKEDGSEAAAEVDAGVAKIIDALVELKIDRDDIVINEMRLDVHYDWEVDPPRPDLAEASRSIDVVVQEIKMFEDVVETAIRNGASTVGHPTLRSNAEAALLQQAQDQAVAQARERAEVLARLFGHSLGPVYGVASGEAREWRWRVRGSGGGLFGDPGDERERAVAFTPRPVERQAMVYAVYLLGPPLDEDDQ